MVKKILLITAGVIVVIAVVSFIWFRSTLPDYEGTLTITGLKAEVQASFDDYGVPHIYADNAEDAYMALGYLHAQDRLFQMEMLRRLAGGRLAEVLGKDLVDIDRLFRTLGLNELAEKNAQAFLSADTAAFQKASHAYLKGINAYIAKGRAPIEFSLTGIPLQPFTDQDIFLIAGYMAFSFAEAMRVDPVMEDLRTRFPGYIEAAFGTYEGNAAFSNRTRSWTDSAGQASTATSISGWVAEALEKSPVPLLIGSNGWVIAGSRTASGKPILANDTHIGYAQPAVWYEAALHYPGFDFYGHHIAGIPFGVLGRNNFCSWGITMFENDDMDFYREKYHPGDSNLVQNGISWDTIRTRTEIIKVKDGSDVSLYVRTTRHGPILNGLNETFGKNEPPVSLWWSFQHEPANLITAIYDLDHAQSLDQARTAVSRIGSPGLNMLYADTAGNIAWWAAAHLPVRSASQNRNSRFYLDGTDPAEDHVAFHPFNQNPQAVNPPWGYVHSGNNQPDSVNGLLFAGYFFPPDRAGRIEQLLKEKSNWTPEDASRMQLDHHSMSAPETAKAISEVLGEDPLADILKKWDGNHSANQTEPAVYYNLLSHIIHYAMADEIGVKALRAFMNTSVMKYPLVHLMRNDSTGWWDDVRTPQKETRTYIIQRAAARTRQLLEEKCGKDPNGWTWGKIHYLKYNHPLGSVKLLDRFFSVGPYPADGGMEVINNLMFALDTTGVFPVTAGPALRKVHDLSDGQQGITVSPTGQSGVLGSRYYADQAQMFAGGKSRPMLFHNDQNKTLKLIPAER